MFGVFAFELLLGDTPFYGGPGTDLNAVERRTLENVVRQKVTRIPAKWSDELDDFV